MAVRLPGMLLVGVLVCVECWITTSSLDIAASRQAREQLQHSQELLATPKPTVSPNDFYLMDHCHNTYFTYFYDDNREDYIHVNDSIRLRLDRARALSSSSSSSVVGRDSGSGGIKLKCYATVVSAQPGYRLRIHFNSINISSRYLYLYGRLHIYDGETMKGLTPAGGLVGNYSNQRGAPRELRLPAFDSLSSSLFLCFEGIPTFSSFDAVVTVFKNSTNGSCGNSGQFFFCNVSRLCIPASLQCDGQVNCGGVDTSDEYMCQPRMSDDLNYSQQLDLEVTGIMIGSAISLLILLIVCVWFAVMCVKRLIMKRDLRRLLRSMAATHPPVAPDPNRIYIPPHAAMAMLSPPPCYSENTPPRRSSGHRSRLELPPPYWSDNSQRLHPTDTDRLIPAPHAPLAGAEREAPEDQLDSCTAAAASMAARIVFSPNSELPQYSSRDDLPTYAAATCGSGSGSEVAPLSSESAPPVSHHNNAPAANNNDGSGGGDNIMAHLQTAQHRICLGAADEKDDAETVSAATPKEENHANQQLEDGREAPVQV